MPGLVVFGSGSPREAVETLRHDRAFDAKVLLVIYVRVESDEKVRLTPVWFMWRHL